MNDNSVIGVARPFARLAVFPNRVSSHPQRRRRKHKGKSVATTDELVLHRIFIAIFIVAAIAGAGYLTYFLSRR